MNGKGGPKQPPFFIFRVNINWSDGGGASVHHNSLAGYEAGRVRCEKEDRMDHFRGFSDTPHGDGSYKMVVDVLV